MENMTINSKRRNIFLGAGVAAMAVAGSAFFLKYKVLIFSKNIEEMTEEYSMLKNIELRRKKLGNAPLIIKNASFTKEMNDLFCENTQFIECYFCPGINIVVSSFENVHFESCEFMNSRVGRGLWENVTFHKAIGRAKFILLADEGSRNIEFKECDFMGVFPVDGMNHENYFGSIGSKGDVTFIDCSLKYIELEAGKGLTIKGGKLEKINAPMQRGTGTLTIDKVICKNYIDFEGSEFGIIDIKNSSFEDLRMVRLVADKLNIENCTLKLMGHLMKVRDARIRACTFHSEGDPSNIYERQLSALSTFYAKINHLHIEDVRFTGTNGSLFIGGEVNVLYKPKSAKPSLPFTYSTYDKVTIKNTSLKGAFFSYVQAGEIDITGCDIENADFSHSQFGVLSLTKVKLAGKIDFSDSIVKQIKQTEVTRAPNVELIKHDATVNL